MRRWGEAADRSIRDPLMPSSRAEEFAREFTTHGRFVWSYIRTLVPHKADAEDIFQDVNTKLWQKFDEFESGTTFARGRHRSPVLRFFSFTSEISAVGTSP